MTVEALLALAILMPGQGAVTGVITPDSTLNRAFEQAGRDLPGSAAASPTAASIGSLDLLGYGQFDTVRRLLDRQRRAQGPDGRIPARPDSAAPGPEPGSGAPPFIRDTDLVATSFWLAALYEYWLYTADTAFVRTVWPVVFDAYTWALDRDRDGDRLPETADGRDQEIHRVAVWLEGLRGLSDLAAAVGDMRLARQAAQNFELAWSGFERRYYVPEAERYAFGFGRDGRPDTRVTAWPAVAMAYSLLETARVETTLAALGSHRLMTDWGVRTHDAADPRYVPDDPARGAVSRSLTGFAAWAGYNYHRPHLAYTLLLAGSRTAREEAASEYPAYPARYSGDLYRRLDRREDGSEGGGLEVIPTALLQGLFGLRVDAPRNRLTFAPHLPAGWDSVHVTGFPVGRSRVDLQLIRRREAGHTVLFARLRRRGGTESLSVRYRPALPPGSRILDVRLNGEPREFERRRDFDDPHPEVRLRLDRSAGITVRYEAGPAVIPIRPDPSPGEPSSALRIIRYAHEPGRGRYRLRVEGRTGRRYTIGIISPGGAPRNPTRGRMTAIGADRFHLTFELPGTPEDWVGDEIEFTAP